VHGSGHGLTQYFYFHLEELREHKEKQQVQPVLIKLNVAFKLPCGGGVEYLHRSPASRK
jgi:hypothetical protein